MEIKRKAVHKLLSLLSTGGFDYGMAYRSAIAICNKNDNSLQELR